MTAHLVGKDLLLSLVAMLEQFLDNIVAEDIGHQLEAVWLDLAENLLLFIAVRSLELLLDEPRAMLVTAELNDMVVDILQLVALVAFAVCPELFKQRATNNLGRVMVTLGARDQSSGTKTTEMSDWVES